MKFSEIKYERPDVRELQQQIAAQTECLRCALTYTDAKAAFLEYESLQKRITTLSTLANIRHDIDTRDPFYDAEVKFWNGAAPELEEYAQGWTEELLRSPFRLEFSAEYGDLMFVNAEIAKRTFSPEIIPELQEENELTTAYEDLLASAQIPFEGGIFTLSQLTPYKTDGDDSRRLAAWVAEGQWYKANQAKMDEIYDRLVHLRDTMGRKLGHNGYTKLGYDRMGRNCYGVEEIESFRALVRAYLVPLADEVYRAQAKRLGKAYPMSYADNALSFRSGNPRPIGDAERLLEAGQQFYDTLSPLTGAFFRMMRESELMDVLSTEGKSGGGYCTDLTEYGVPFIFANFNGTQGDVEVITHEAGHAFAGWLNRDRVPMEYAWPGMEGCEVHSMSMEFFAEAFAEHFFGEDADKFRYSHLADALTFIPYGTMVDHFQHIMYEKPDLSPAERHAVWKELTGMYMPWVKLDGAIPFYAEGEAWQRQHHIYSSPFYYIDYCLAQTVSLQIWAMIQSDREAAWQNYMSYTEQGGSATFTELLKNAGLDSPFEERCLRTVCETAAAYLRKFDQSKIG